MRMKLSSKRDIGVRLLWVLALAAVAVKLLLCSQQLFEAVPQASTIDDTLMFEMARSIRAYGTDTPPEETAETAAKDAELTDFDTQEDDKWRTIRL